MTNEQPVTADDELRAWAREQGYETDGAFSTATRCDSDFTPGTSHEEPNVSHEESAMADDELRAWAQEQGYETNGAFSNALRPESAFTGAVVDDEGNFLPATRREFPELAPCRGCGRTVHREATACPGCGCPAPFEASLHQKSGTGVSELPEPVLREHTVPIHVQDVLKGCLWISAAAVGVFFLSWMNSANNHDDSDGNATTRFRQTSASASNDRLRGRLQQHERTRDYSAPETMLGNRSNSYEDHARDARAWLIQDAREAVRNGQMSVSEFEEWTHTEY